MGLPGWLDNAKHRILEGDEVYKFISIIISVR